MKGKGIEEILRNPYYKKSS